MEQDHELSDRLRVTRQIDAARIAAKREDPAGQGTVVCEADHPDGVSL